MKGLLTISVIFGALVAVSVSLRGMTLPNEEVCFVPGGPCYLVEIANDPGERARWLMGRTSLDLDRGMLFVFETEEVANFWMRDTSIPLYAVWIAGDGRVLGSTVMSPCPDGAIDCPNYPSPAPVRWVLEIPIGAVVPEAGSVMTLSGSAGD